MIPYAMVLLASVIGALGAFWLKRGAATFRLSVTAVLRNRAFLLGVFLYVAAIPVYLVGLSGLPLSVAYPITGLTYVWSTLLAARYLKERVTMTRWAGILAIVAGTALAVLP